MKILLVAATYGELHYLMNYFNLKDDNQSFMRNFMCNNTEIEICITGIGMIDTIYTLTKNIFSHSYNLVIHAGICGAFNKNLHIGEVVYIQSDRFSELGAQDDETFLSIFELGLADENNFPYVHGAIKSNNKIDLPCIQMLKKVDAITVNTVHGNTGSIEKVIRKFNPQIETMEGAAVAYVCKRENIPLIHVRAISNYVEKRNKENWNIKLAVTNLNQYLVELLKELTT